MKGRQRRSNLPAGLKVHFQKASRFQTRLNYVLFVGILFYSVSLWIKCKCNIKWGALGTENTASPFISIMLLRYTSQCASAGYADCERFMFLV